jgi:hypothetical protein
MGVCRLPTGRGSVRFCLGQSCDRNRVNEIFEHFRCYRDLPTVFRSLVAWTDHWLQRVAENWGRRARQEDQLAATREDFWS